MGYLTNDLKVGRIELCLIDLCDNSNQFFVSISKNLGEIAIVINKTNYV